jgi:hypothetical protein
MLEQSLAAAGLRVSETPAFASAADGSTETLLRLVLQVVREGILVRRGCA